MLGVWVGGVRMGVTVRGRGSGRVRGGLGVDLGIVLGVGIEPG